MLDGFGIIDVTSIVTIEVPVMIIQTTTTFQLKNKSNINPVALHRNVPYFIHLFCPMPDNFTCQGKALYIEFCKFLHLCLYDIISNKNKGIFEEVICKIVRNLLIKLISITLTGQLIIVTDLFMDN
jgi:hypothetical protein